MTHKLDEASKVTTPSTLALRRDAYDVQSRRCEHADPDAVAAEGKGAFTAGEFAATLLALATQRQSPRKGKGTFTAQDCAPVPGLPKSW